MKAIAILIITLSMCRVDADPLDIPFYIFDFIDGFATALFDEAGADKATDCLEDIKEIELIIVDVKNLIKNFDAKTLIMEIVKVISDLAEIFDDCKQMPAQFKVLMSAFQRMITAFESNISVAMMKLVLGIVGEGTNLLEQIKSIIANSKSHNYFTVGNQVGRIIAMLTIKLY